MVGQPAASFLDTFRPIYARWRGSLSHRDWRQLLHDSTKIILQILQKGVDKMKQDVLNIHQFRRLFPVVVRPPKKTIIQWIENGTREGKKAPAFTVDGQYFIETEKAREFVKTLGFEPVETVEK